MIPVPELVEISDGLRIGLPSGLRMSQERSFSRPTVNRYYLTPVVIAASSWQAAEPDDDLAGSVIAELCAAYPQRTAAPDCEDIGRIDRSGAAGRALAHFDWETGGGRLVRSHLAVFTGADGEVAVLHLTVPQRLASETAPTVNELIESARFHADPEPDQTISHNTPAVTPAISQGATTP